MTALIAWWWWWEREEKRTKTEFAVKNIMNDYKIHHTYPTNHNRLMIDVISNSDMKKEKQKKKNIWQLDEGKGRP